jgi:hypothetical protein
VTWSTDDPGGSVARNAEMTAIYTPGGTPGTYHVTVTSVADTSRSATAEVTVLRPQVTLSITPPDTGLVTGQSLSFGSTIQVTGSSNTSLVWTCSGGTLLPKGASAFYTAPLVPGTYTVTATSVANPEVSATATLQVSASATSTPALSTLPSAATLLPNQRLSIGTSYRINDPSTGLDWTASGGTLAVDASTASAFFSAPAEGAYTVSLASRSNPALTAQVAVTVLPPLAPAWAITPSALTLRTGEAAFFEAVDISGAIGSRVLWSIQEGPAGGTMSDAGQYFAPTTGGTYHLVVTNPDVPAETATATITVISNGGGGPDGGGDPTPTNLGITVAPETSSLPAGTYQSLSAVVSGMDDQSVTWTVENAPAEASVDAAGVFTASQTGAYRVFATSTASPALNGSAVLTVVSSVTAIPTAPAVGTLRGYTVTALADGRILVAGGTDGTTDFASARLFDPETKAFTDTPPMLTPRTYHSATVLADGRVLMAGGVGARDAWGNLLANPSAEVFNPITNAFEALPERTTPSGGSVAGYMRSPHATSGFLATLENDGHGQSAATVLGNGQVLIVGGPLVHGYGFGGGIDQFRQRRMSDVFTPGIDTFDVSNWVGTEVPGNERGWALTPNAAITPKGSQAVTLDNGRALMTGGMVDPYEFLPVIPEPYRSGLIMPDSKVFDPASGFADASPMSVPRAYHTMTKLPDGRVLVVGGYASLTLTPDFNTTHLWHRTTTPTAELYNPATGAFTATGNLSEARARHAAILLPTGKVMIVGGRTTYGDGTYSYPKTIEVFDPETGTFSVMDHLDYGLEEPKLAMQADGNVFVAGMVQGSAAASLRTQGQAFQAATLPPGILAGLLLGQIATASDFELNAASLNQAVTIETSVRFNAAQSLFTAGKLTNPNPSWKGISPIQDRDARVVLKITNGTGLTKGFKVHLKATPQGGTEREIAVLDASYDSAKGVHALTPFVLPGALARPDTQFVLVIDPEKKRIQKDQPYQINMQIAFEEVPAVNVYLVPIKYVAVDQVNSQPVRTPYELNATELEALRTQLEQQFKDYYPVSMGRVNVLSGLRDRNGNPAQFTVPDSIPPQYFTAAWSEDGFDENGQALVTVPDAPVPGWRPLVSSVGDVWTEFSTYFMGLLGAPIGPFGMTPRPRNTYLIGVVKTVPGHNKPVQVGQTYTTGGSNAGISHFAVTLSESALDMLHEVGHAHDRPHAPFGGVRNPDPNWPTTTPYKDAAVGVEGFQQSTKAIIPATKKDIMSYPPDRTYYWISDYTFSHILEWERLSAQNGDQ